MSKAGIAAIVALLATGACAPSPPDPRGVGRDETLLQVSASGSAETKPDEARFAAGVASVAATAGAATLANNAKMNAVVAALKVLGVEEKDIQTQRLTVARQDWGANRGKFEANNVVSVRIRDVTKAGEAIAAATQAGANIVSGPDLRVADPEAASRSAYTAAYKAARARAETYAQAAGLKVARVLAIRDGGGQPSPYPMLAEAYERMSANEARAAPPVLAGTSAANVTVQVDFALAK